MYCPIILHGCVVWASTLLKVIGLEGWVVPFCGTRWLNVLNNCAIDAGVKLNLKIRIVHVLSTAIFGTAVCFSLFVYLLVM